MGNLNVQDIKDQVKAVVSNPKLLITWLWFTTLVFGAQYCLSAIVFAVNNNGDDDTDSKSLGFAAIWMMILILALSYGGTMVLRHYQTPFAVGFFSGVVITMSFSMFAMMVLFSGLAYDAKHDKEGNGDVHTNEASAAFSFFMFFLYLVFAAVLLNYRNVIIKEGEGVSKEKSFASAQQNQSNPTTLAAPAPPVSV